MGFLDTYIQFRKRTARFLHPVEVALYILIASLSLLCILNILKVFLESYEYFDLTPSPCVVYVNAALQYGWPTWLVFFLTLALFIYYEVSFPFLHSIR
jgi:high-affinity K+ transport system ATPase subunit B